LREQSDKFAVTVFTDLNKQNDILVQHGQKKIKKVERKFHFGNISVCRDFIFHLKRLYHYHNCTGADNKTPPLQIEIKK